MALTEKLTAIADAIRGKTGKTEELTLEQMASEITGIQTGGGDSSIEDGFITRTLTEYSNDRVENVAEYAFANSTSLTSVSLPKVNTIGTYGFRNCSSLVSVYIPKIDVILSDAFVSCGALETIDLFNLQRFSGRCFSTCSKLKTIILRSATVTPLYNVNVLHNTPFAVGGTGGTVYVHQEQITQYQQETNWSILYEAGTCNFVAIEGSEYE